jgi:hypothetical protein
MERGLRALWRDVCTVPTCCGWSMREVRVHPNDLTVLICDHCHSRRWLIGGEVVSSRQALRAARRLDRAV